MYIFSQDQSIMLNSDNVTAFSIVDRSSGIDDAPPIYSLIADGYELGCFDSEEECTDRMCDILSQIMSGAKSYEMSRSIHEK